MAKYPVLSVWQQHDLPKYGKEARLLEEAALLYIDYHLIVKQVCKQINKSNRNTLFTALSENMRYNNIM
jgi:hypothetical protein